MVDVFHRQIELVFMAFAIAALFHAAICQESAERNAVGIEGGDHSVIEAIRGGDRPLAIIEFGKADLGIDVDGGLLVNPALALNDADIESVLGAAIAWAFALELTGLVVNLGLF